ncbi:hypothetical protein C8259_08930 [Nocardia nova]|uniref:Uncharacterized protein n=2 Tax=Nocardiaceae TaxID=85025 RepID=A0A2T2Z891_9NOCA|nr:hypothetical protein C8259_08930 [Nocardia nova]
MLRAMVLVGTALAAVTELLDPEPQQPPVEPAKPAAVDPVTECRDALELAAWSASDHLTAHAHGLTAECTCGCGQVETVVGPDVPNAGAVAGLAAVATNNLAAVLDRLADAEAERDQAVREADGDRQLVDVLRAQRREAHERLRATRAHAHELHAVIADHEQTIVAAQSRIAELQYARDARLAELNAARASRAEAQLADIRALASGWAEQGVGSYAITAQTAYRRDAGREILAILDRDETTAKGGAAKAADGE